MHNIKSENTGDDGENRDLQNKLILACARGDSGVSLPDLSPEWIEPCHLYMAIDCAAPIPEFLRWLLDTLPLSLIHNYHDPETDLTPMEVLMQAILAQEEMRRYHKENSTRVEMNWECVRLLAVKQLGCHPETPILHACLQLHLQDSSRVPFSLLQHAFRAFSHQALAVDPSSHLPLHIALAAAAKRRRQQVNGRDDGSDDYDDDDDDSKELMGLIEKVLRLNPTAAGMRDPDGRLPLDVAIVTDFNDLACQLAQCKAWI